MPQPRSTGPRKLLFLCQTLPYPPDGGANIRSYHLLRLLAQEFEVTALCFYRNAIREGQVEASTAGLRELGISAEAYAIPQEQSVARYMWDHVRSVMSGRAYTTFTYQSKIVERELRRLLRSTRFDLVHVDSLDLAYYLPLLKGLPTVCGHHNIESALLERRARAQDSSAKRWYMGLQARLTRREEARLAPTVALNLTCSEEDANTLTEIAPGADAICIPNGVDTEAFVPQRAPDPQGIVFVGGYTWFPNRDGMAWFVHQVLPRIRERLPDTPVTWVGRMPDQEGTAYREQFGINVTGYVDDIRPFVSRAACFVVPIRVGGGTRLKILDAWAMGQAVVSTSVGCEGLVARDGENIVIGDSAEEFAEAVVAVLEDRALQHRLSEAGRETVERHYDWRIIGEKLITEYDSLLSETGHHQLGSES